MMNNLILFRDMTDAEATSQYGILIDDIVVCLCCGGIVDKEDCEILEYPTIDVNISDLLKKELEE